MSSFNVNGPNMNSSMLQGSQNLGKDGGGGGNTGYMNMRKKKKNKDDEDDNSVFLEDPKDTFETEAGPKETPKGKFLGALSKFIHEKTEPKPKSKDYFTKSEPEVQQKEEQVEDEYETDEYDEFEEYNITTNEAPDSVEDDEYEVVEDDDYYGGIDI